MSLLYNPLACEGCDNLSCLNSTAYPRHLFSSLRILLLSSLLTFSLSLFLLASLVGIAGSAPELSSHPRGPSYRCKGQSMASLVLSWLVECITRGSADVVEAAHPRCMLRPFSASRIPACHNPLVRFEHDFHSSAAGRVFSLVPYIFS